MLGYVSLCQYTNITLVEWLGLGNDSFTQRYGLPKIILKSVGAEVEKMANQIKSERNKQAQDLKLAQNEAVSPLQNMKPNASLQRLFG